MSPVVDTLATAREILANPVKRFTVPTLHVICMARALVDIADQEQSTATTSAPLAVAIAKFIQADEAFTSSLQPDGYYSFAAYGARQQAFTSLKSAFETEFPHV